MATIPTPRSYNQILGAMVDGFQARQGIDTLLVGSPLLSIMESAAQSDLRVTQDLFGFLNSIALERAEGDALDRIGADEDLPRRTETFASTKVTIGDSSFTKQSTKVYVGKPAPIIGSATLYVVDAALFTSSGQVYIGRGTTNFEGPLSYTAKTNHGSYWSLTLAGGSETQKFHNHNEPVVLAQGGNRAIVAGTVIQTQQGNAAEAIQFSTLYSVTLPDGEVSITGVQVVAKRPGIDGNVPAGAIRSFAASPFTGATVTNPLPVANALPAEDDRSYRERIRKARQSRAKGTALAIEQGVLGTLASDENKSVLSAKVVTREGYPTTLYIDDGNGYEERTSGVPIESLVPLATGGEQYFEVNSRPVAKAFCETSIEEPFALQAGAKLKVKVNGIAYEHTFSDDEFRAIDNATAFECIASINGDDALPFDARLSGDGKKFSIYADDDTGEDIEVVDADEGEIDANDAFGFSAGRADTMLLYRNDRLLNKDGRLAIAESRPQSLWAAALTSPATLNVEVDSTGVVGYTFTAQDFIDQHTGYVTLSSANSLDSWVKVFNSRIPGITAEKSGTQILLVSNVGPDERARVRITGGTLVSEGMFSIEDATGLARDYTLDRNTGQLRLETPLSENETLALGTASTRAFIESTDIPTTTLISTADQYWVVDGAASRVAVGVGPGSVLTLADYNTTPPGAWGDRVRVTAASGTPFSDVLVGDWAIFTDSVFSANNRGAWRIAHVDSGGTYFEIERPTAGWTPQAAIALTTGGLTFVRTEAQVQRVSIAAAANYTAASFADEINADLRGATAEVYHTTRLRVRTNSFGASGDIALVAQNVEAEKLQLTAGDYVDNATSHLGAVESSNREHGTPEFELRSISAVASTSQFTRGGASSVTTSGHQLVFQWPVMDQDTGTNKRRWGNAGYHSAIELIAGNVLTVRQPALQEFLPAELFYAAAPFAIGPEDQFGALIDENEESERYVLPMWRSVKATTSTYGVTNQFTDTDNGGASLAQAFGLSYDWKDFAAWMKARTKSHSEAGDTTKTILWRFVRFGPEGHHVKIRYVYPTAASSSIAVTSDSLSDGNVQVRVSLPTGAARTGVTVRNTTKIGLMAAAGPGVIQTLTYVLGFSVSSAARVVKLRYRTQTANFTVGSVLTGASSGATATISADSDAGATGTLTLTAVVGTFTDGEIITDAVTGSATADGTQFGETTLTLDVATPGATDHGFQVNDVIYLNSTNVNFASGLRTVTARTLTTVTYTDVVSTAQVATPNIGTVSFDVGEATLTGSTVVNGDLANVNVLAGLTSAYERTVRTTTVGAQYWKGVADTALATGTVISWFSLIDASYLSFFPIDTAVSKASDIATAVNALAAVTDSTCPVTAVAVGDGVSATGVVSQASYDEFSATADKSYSFTDGQNWVRSQVNPVLPINHYQFTFKDAVTATLATNSDWANEEVRLTPVTTKNVVDWFNTQGVSGLSSVAENARAGGADRPQVSTLLPGSDGAVRVQGGTANSVSVPIVGAAATVSGGYAALTIKKSDAVGLRGRHWVKLQNTNTMPKQVFTSATVIGSFTSAGVFTADATSPTNLWNWANTATGAINGFTWMIQRHGDFVCYLWDTIGAVPDLAGIKEGDWVTITGGTINVRNQGTFRVVRVDNTTPVFWVENDNSLDEIATANLSFRTYDSIMPGDTLHLNDSIAGASNVGVWTVLSIDATDRKRITVDIASRVPVTFTGPVTVGASAPLTQVYETAATHLIKKIRSISPNTLDGTLVDVKLETDLGYRQVSNVAGTLVQSLDKLDFATDLFSGIDGYRYNTGLIREVNRVAYGDPADAAAYPGIIAAGAQVNIQGPLIKRIACALALRLKSGVSAVDIINRVKSAVASVINATGVGEAVAISDIVEAANGVGGVVAVTVLSPTYSVGNDLISVQPFEKPSILDLDQDIQVSLVGA